MYVEPSEIMLVHPDNLHAHERTFDEGSCCHGIRGETERWYEGLKCLITMSVAHCRAILLAELDQSVTTEDVDESLLMLVNAAFHCCNSCSRRLH